ncbi:MAG TPA: tRNA (N(6)-L-threonylcarbamoyladenosine(37)-C(2))-methylthiotransferase MtaB [Spirochaetia bacterium]|nr:tRNA (N(6)-L-threonylcarbamoyladenosine(37)-C(2))-methylthiotransferase MtaB [Spirochaetia bacterium]HRZ66026.1 tRNA (N(6)-L-threonylcarbamoyladenosine(37)-C(2))-methylthiotransferase MtaB [Spirochaetia bacterium]
MRYTVAFRSLGCKLNQLESESAADAFRRAGWTVLSGAAAGPAPDLVVVNTCTVTSKAEQKARRIARSALAESPSSLVLLTGCYAQVEAEALSALDSRALVLPGEDKASLLGLPDWLGENWQGHGELGPALREWLAGPGAREADRFAYRPERFAFHSRPSLKIQDGCDNRCAYCRVCIARGPSSSLAAGEVLERARELEEGGAAEIVLTGVNLSQYRSEGRSFPGLLRLLIEGTSSVPIRLSSYEPEAVDAEFIEAFAHPRIRPHAHLPVQSGSDPLLAAMGRRYRRDRVVRAVEALRRARGDPFIACDLIAGFPGESEADFAATVELARACGFAWIHAFPFSPRPGTRAWELRPRVPERVAGERVELLTALAREGRAAYAARWAGRELSAVLEEGAGRGTELEAPGTELARMDGEPGTELQATSENYLKLRLRGAPAGLRRGSALRCRTAPLGRGPTGTEPGFRGQSSGLGGAGAAAGGQSSDSGFDLDAYIVD